MRTRENKPKASRSLAELAEQDEEVLEIVEDALEGGEEEGGEEEGDEEMEESDALLEGDVDEDEEGDREKGGEAGAERADGKEKVDEANERGAAPRSADAAARAARQRDPIRQLLVVRDDEAMF